MSSEMTIDAVSLALRTQELQARVASLNIANANRPGSQAMRIDLDDATRALKSLVQGASRAEAAAALQYAESTLQSARPVRSASTVNLDQEVESTVVAGAQYQALSEALSRQFGLMRLAVSGRS